jgi:SAM-dependent methyltransferase
MSNAPSHGVAREMSRYIPIDDYHAYEDQHPFYEEMTSLMRRTIGEAYSQWSGSERATRDQFRVLEFGAGTGIFTRSLAAALPSASIVAVELDSVCAGVLREQMSGFANVRCEMADSTRYRGQKKADFVVTSFADHHIHDSQKPAYFVNIGANLLDDGMFISGEEFLPDYDEHEGASRDTAIVAYHTCILELIANLADERARTVLSALESAAMQSGLERHGDFKISAALYRRLLAESGFRCDQIKLGPTNRDGVGGVFVNVMRRMQGTVFAKRGTCAHIPIRSSGHAADVQ